MKNSKTQLSKMVQSGGFIEITDKMYGSGMRTALELPGIINSIDKGKSVSKALLGAGYNLVDNKTDINRSTLIRDSGLTSTNNEIKDIAKIIRSLENS